MDEITAETVIGYAIIERDGSQTVAEPMVQGDHGVEFTPSGFVLGENKRVIDTIEAPDGLYRLTHESDGTKRYHYRLIDKL